MRTVTPGNLPSNALPTASATCRSTEVYQTTLPSLRAASISCGVTVSGAGGAACTTSLGQANAPAEAAAPCRTRRRVSFALAIDATSQFLSWRELQTPLAEPARALPIARILAYICGLLKGRRLW